MSAIDPRLERGNAPSADSGGAAAGRLPPWQTGNLPPAPTGGWTTWLRLLGPGVLLAGASIGSGEWLAGPGLTAQYGGALLWVATLAIVCQVFCNLEMMRYTLYCGEPIQVGYLRTWPGPRFWVIVYLILDFSSIWPFNAAFAAVPLAAAFLGHLPQNGAEMALFGFKTTEDVFRMGLAYVVFLLAFVPLIFGGTVAKMLERTMALKLVVVLTYLVVVGGMTISATNAREVLTGLVGFGTIPLRPDTVISGRHYTYTERDGEAAYTVKGTSEERPDSEDPRKIVTLPIVTEFIVARDGERKSFPSTEGLSEGDIATRQRLADAATLLARPGRFLVEDAEDGVALSMQGSIAENRVWHPDELSVTSAGAPRQKYDTLDAVPAPYRERFDAMARNQGLERANVVSYVREHGRLPDLDWGILATFAAIAGAGGMTNLLFSNFARDKGWGMGSLVGAIPSAIGGRQITLSHVGKVFPVTEENRRNWRGWIRHILRDQVAIWMFCSVVGMALPCMLSLEFIRNAPVAGDRVGAMLAEGIADRYPAYGSVLWSTTLFIGFLILAPGQIVAGDQIARRWTDVAWVSSPRLQHMQGNQVKYVYYGILMGYCLWGLMVLQLNPRQILVIAGVLMNIALAFAALHTLYVNRTLLPRELRPNLLMQLGTLGCGVFYLGVSGIVIANLLKK